MKFLARSISIVLFALPLLAVQANAQDQAILYQPDPDSPIGERNPKAPPETAQFDFVIGDWDIDITYTPAGGKPFSYKAKWHNHWVVDGHVVMQEWRGPYSTGAEFRFFDPQKKRWIGQNVYTGAKWQETSAEFVDGKMYIYSSQSDADGDFLARETYYEIGPDSFKLKAEVSRDNGKSWQAGKYTLVATRSL